MLFVFIREVNIKVIILNLKFIFEIINLWKIIYIEHIYVVLLFCIFLLNSYYWKKEGLGSIKKTLKK